MLSFLPSRTCIWPITFKKRAYLISIDNRDAKLGEGGGGAVALYERKERDTKMYMYVQLSILYYLYDKFNITFLNTMSIPYQEKINAIQD